MKHIKIGVTVISNDEDELPFICELDMINNTIYVYDQNKELYALMTCETQQEDPPFKANPNKIIYSYKTQGRNDPNYYKLYADDHRFFSEIINKMYNETEKRNS